MEQPVTPQIKVKSKVQMASTNIDQVSDVSEGNKRKLDRKRVTNYFGLVKINDELYQDGLSEVLKNRLNDMKTALDKYTVPGSDGVVPLVKDIKEIDENGKLIPCSPVHIEDVSFNAVAEWGPQDFRVHGHFLLRIVHRGARIRLDYTNLTNFFENELQCQKRPFFRAKLTRNSNENLLDYMSKNVVNDVLIEDENEDDNEEDVGFQKKAKVDE